MSAINSSQVQIATNGGITGDSALALTLARIQYINTSDSSNIANTSTETDFNRTATIPAGFFIASMGIRVTAVLKYNSTGLLPTMTIRTYLGTAVLSASNVALIATANSRVICTTQWICRSAGASGAFVRWGSVQADTLAGGSLNTLGASGEVAINTTIANVVKVSVQFSAASLGNSATLETMSVELLR